MTKFNGLAKTQETQVCAEENIQVKENPVDMAKRIVAELRNLRDNNNWGHLSDKDLSELFYAVSECSNIAMTFSAAASKELVERNRSKGNQQ